MRRRLLPLVLMLAVLAPVATRTHASAVGTGVDLETIEARIEKAHARIDRWYARIERWYERIGRDASRVDRLEALVSRRGEGSGAGDVLRRPSPRWTDPAFRLIRATRLLRSTLKDPWARHVRAELDTWNAYLTELVRARERALRPQEPAEEAAEEAGGGGGHEVELDPGEPVTYEAWAGAFLGRLGAPACGDNLLIVVTWETAESTSARFNPLATTREMPGAIDMNDVGVKHFVSLEQGLEAARGTLLLGAESYDYRAIVASLRACASAATTAAAINASAWCRGCVGGAYVTGLLSIVRGTYAEHAARLVSTS
ncbi:MAG: hypothetical protein ACRDGK_05930 [Actinomycetota bacterium]